MIESLVCISVNDAAVNINALCKFDCGNADFNEFLVNDALLFSQNGNGVTYVLVPKDEYESGNARTIMAFATITTMALFFNENEHIHCIPAAEIKYFAISKSLQRENACWSNYTKNYSTLLFEYFLMELYEMSWNTIGFRALFLRANKNGERLYRRKSFVDADNYIIPYSEDDPLGECVPLVLFIQENLYSIFGAD